LLHNTCYSSGSGGIDFVEVDPGLQSITAFNNLVSGVDANERDFPAAQLTEHEGNLVLPPSVFAGGNFEGDWASYELEAGSAAIDVGIARGVSPWDFSGRVRSVDGDGSDSSEPDVGALEFSP
jgi:hypothetical protein